MNIWQRLLFLFIYTFGCIWIVISALGGGHGTIIFLPALLFSPLIFVSFILLSWFSRKPIRIAFVALMVIYYLLTISTTFLIESGDHLDHTRKVLEINPLEFWLYIFWYLMGQVVIWAAFFRQRKLSDQSIP